MVQSPCFDRINKVDCPMRSTFCRADCTAWQKYEKAKVAEMAELHKKKMMTSNTTDYFVKRDRGIKRRKHDR